VILVTNISQSNTYGSMNEASTRNKTSTTL